MRKTLLVCSRCSSTTIHSLLCSEESEVQYLNGEGIYNYEPGTYSLLRCDGCRQISVYVWSPFHNPGSEFGEKTYPADMVLSSAVPKLVRTIYLQAEKIKQHSTIAYAILARKVLEEIIKERGIAERNLAQGMSILAKRGEIPPFLAEAATLIRIFGNTAAHASEEHIDGLHVLMIEKFLATLIEYLYEAPATLNEFKVLLEMEHND